MRDGIPGPREPYSQIGHLIHGAGASPSRTEGAAHSRGSPEYLGSGDAFTAIKQSLTLRRPLSLSFNLLGCLQRLYSEYSDLLPGNRQVDFIGIADVAGISCFQHTCRSPYLSPTDISASYISQHILFITHSFNQAKLILNIQFNSIRVLFLACHVSYHTNTTSPSLNPSFIIR